MAILKSPSFGPPQAGRALPYRIDHLEARGRRLAWVDEHVGPLTPLRRRLEARSVPFAQAWRTRSARRHAVATLAMFESEGHGLALARRLLGRRNPPLVVVACWLTDLAAGSTRRARLYRFLYGAVDELVVFSANQLPVLAATIGRHDRVHVVRFGIDLDELEAIEVTDGTEVVAVGRDLGRDWSTLLAAAAGTGWSVELVTRGRQLDGLVRPAEVRHREPLPRAAYLDLLARAAVVVVPTRVLAYPTGQTVLLEAMALGKACVVTDTPAMREYVVDGETAILVAPHDPAALRAAVAELLADPDRRARIGSAARAAEQAAGGARRMWADIDAVIAAAVAR